MTMMGKPFTLLLLLLASTLVEADAANPVSKFLMMGSKRNGSAARGGDSNENTDAELQALTKRVRAAEDARDKAVRDQESMSQAMARLEHDLSDYQAETALRIEQLSSSSDSAALVASVQDDSAERMEQVKVRYEGEVTELNDRFAKREEETKARFEQELLDVAQKQTDLQTRYDSELEQASRASEQRVRELTDEFHRKIADTTSSEREAELLSLLADKEAELKGSQAAFAESSDDLNKKIEVLGAKVVGETQNIVTVKEEVRAEMIEEMTKMTDKHAEDLKAVQEEIVSLKVEKTELQQVIANHHDRVALVQEESTQALLRALAEHEKEVELLKDQVATAATAKQKIATVKRELEKTVVTLQSDLKETKADLAYWENLFGAQPYCNFTHMQDDVVSMFHMAQRTTSAKFENSQKAVQELIGTTSDSLHQHSSKLAEAVAPYTKKGDDFYVAHLKVHVKKLKDEVHPHFEKHVAPVLEKARATVSEAVTGAKNGYKVSKGEVVLQFKKACPGLLSSLANAHEKHGIPVPVSFSDSVKSSCSEPDETVFRFLKVILVVLAILNRRLLWRVFTGIVYIAIRIVWFFSPLRLFLKCFKSSKKEEPNTKSAKKLKKL